MENEKKSRYTEAQAKASAKYIKDNLEEIKFRVPKGQKQIIKDFAASCGKSVNQFIYDAIVNEMNR